MECLQSQGAFLSVRSNDAVNVMTISWGNTGFMWQKPVFAVMVRKSRYTFELIERTDNFTVSIPFCGDMKKALMICGTRSGREIDKHMEAGLDLIPSRAVDAPLVRDCEMYYECKIIYKQPMDRKMLKSEIQESFYGKDDYHTIYYGEIVSAHD